MDGLAGYGSEDSENSQCTPAKKNMNQHQVVSPLAASQTSLEAEWESFQKMISAEDDGIPSIPLPPSAASMEAKPAPAATARAASSSEDEDDDGSDDASGKVTKDKRKSTSSSGSSDEDDKSGSESADSSDESSEDSADEKPKAPSVDVEKKEVTRQKVDVDPVAAKKGRHSSRSSSESDPQSGPTHTSRQADGRNTALPKERRPSRHSPPPPPPGKRRRSRSRSAERRRPRHRSRSRSRERHKRRRRPRRSRSRGRRSGSRSRDRPGRRRSRSRDRRPSDGGDRGDDKSTDRRGRSRTPTRSDRRRSRSHSPRRRRRSRSRTRRARRSMSRSPHRSMRRRRRRRRRRKRRPSGRISRSRSRSRSRSPVVKKKRNEPLNYKEQLKQSLLQVQKQAAEGKLNLDELAAKGTNLAASSEKPSNLPLVTDNPLIAMAAGKLGQVTPQQALLQTMAAMHQKAQELTGVAVPKYYNPASVNPLKYAEQVQKRKLLWSKNKDKPAPTETGTTAAVGTSQEPQASAKPKSQWDGALFSQDQDGKQTAKFRKLMGIKDGEGAATGSVGTGGSAKEGDDEEANSMVRKQQELFSRLDQEYEFARMATHTHRGIGLGFTSMHQQYTTK